MNPCPLCGQTRQRNLPLDITLCLDCGLSRRSTLPDPVAMLQDLRREKSLHPALLEQQRKGKQSLRTWEMDQVAFLCPAGRLLDVGCGYGFFLELARTQGWEVEGLELSRPEWRYATEKFGLAVQNKTLEETRFPENHFDVVTLWEVVELLPDPFQTLQEVFRVLKPGGWLFLRTNNASFHLPALTWQRRPPFKWWGVQPGIFHLFGWTPPSLNRALAKVGFGHTHHEPSHTTTGDPYALGGRLGPGAVVAGKKIMGIFAQTVYRATGQIFSTAFISRAQKPDARPSVIHLITRLDVGGSSENVVYSMQKTDPQKFRSLLVAGKSQTPTEALTFHPLELPSLKRKIHLIKDLNTFFHLQRLFRALGPLVVHTHSSKAGILGRWAAWAAGVPHIIHTPHGHVFYGYSGFFKSRFYSFLEKITAWITDTLVALTEGEKQESLAWGVGRENQWRVIPSGVTWDSEIVKKKETFRREGRQKFSIPPEALVVGTVGRLDPVKGMVCLAQAAQELLKISLPAERSLYFLFVGDGSQRETIQEIKAASARPDRFILAGHQSQVFSLMASMDIYVQPSLNEGMGKTLVLAQAMGLPVVASRVCGVPSVVKEGETGLLVPPKDAHALALALNQLMEDPGLCQRFSQNGPAWVAQKIDGHGQFSVERMIFLLERLYKSYV